MPAGPLGLHFRERMVPATTLSTSYLRSSQRIACRTSSHKFPVCATHRRNCFHSKTLQSSNLKGMTRDDIKREKHINIKRGSRFCMPNIGQSVLQENTLVQHRPHHVEYHSPPTPYQGGQLHSKERNT